MSRLKGGSRPSSTERAPPTSTRNTLPNSSSKAIACRSGISRRLAMANLRPRLLQPMLASALLISATPTLALQTIDARDGVSVEASIALKEATRIKVDGANITEVFGNIYSSNCGGVAADVRVEEVNRPVQLWTESRFTMLRLYESRGLIGEKYLLTNISNEPMVLAEQEFDREQGDVVGVSIESHNLRPGESTNVFVLRQRN